MLPDGVRQIGQSVRVKLLPWLGSAALYLGNGQVQAGFLLFGGHHVVPQQGGQSPT